MPQKKRLLWSPPQFQIRTYFWAAYLLPSPFNLQNALSADFGPTVAVVKSLEKSKSNYIAKIHPSISSIPPCAFVLAIRSLNFSSQGKFSWVLPHCPTLFWISSLMNPWKFGQIWSSGFWDLGDDGQQTDRSSSSMRWWRQTWICTCSTPLAHFGQSEHHFLTIHEARYILEFIILKNRNIYRCAFSVNFPLVLAFLAFRTVHQPMQY